MDNKLTKADINELLSKRFENDIHTTLSSIPHPSKFKDMQKASKRIKEAIKNHQKIAVVGDYDADGVVSSVIMAEFFEDIGVEIDLIIPNRFRDGYGISKNIVKNLDVDLIITVDNGISAIEAADVCKSRGIDLIITDHHTVAKTLPCAYAVVNPKQEDCDFPSSEICGAQVAWYLIAAIKDELNIEYNLSKFLDILAIAIVADMMELKDINRTMVKSGLKVINSSKRAVFKVIKEFFNKRSFKSEDISFLLAPLINSSGRIEDASHSCELLRAKSSHEAFTKLEYIVDLNNRRKLIEQELFSKSITSIDESKNIIVSWGEDWHEGVIGIVASRLTRKYKKPAIVFSINGDVAKGSARTIGSINILEHIAKFGSLLLGFGGHKGAAGMSIEAKNLELLKESLEDSFQGVDPKEFMQKSEVLGEIDPDIIDFELLDILEAFEPYGQKNPKPNFILKNAYVKVGKVIGQNQNHQKLTLLSENKTLESVEFNFDKEIESGHHIDIICSVSKNEFRGIVLPQLMIRQVIQE